MILDAKSNLARLLATENILVEQKKVETAYFNLKTRTLVMPILKQELSGELYDLFIGHEVGHALNTPLDGWHDSIKDMGVKRSILNVCEDVRIEKLIRRKFPGLKTSFIKAYKELLDMDFFGLSEIDDKTLNLIDRINLHTKCGVSVGMKFEGIEAELLQEAESTETFEDVVDVAMKIQNYMKQVHQSETQTDVQASEDVDEAGDESDMDSEEEGSTTNTEEVEGEGTNSNSQKGDELESKTDQKFREKEKNLFDHKSYNDLEYGNIPELDSSKIIVGYKQVIREIKESDSKNKYKIDTKLFSEFRGEVKKTVAYLVKEFELRKNADMMKKASVAKTGDLNMNRIFSYQFSEDIFKKITITPNGKSHGLVLFLDWSGSMSNCMKDTIKQLLTLVLFCKSVQIPFEVYAFSNYYGNTKRYYSKAFLELPYKDGDLAIERFALLNLLSSKMNMSEMTYMASALLDSFYKGFTDTFYKMAVDEKGNYGAYPEGRFDNYTLGATPLNETIIAAMDLIPKFQKANRLQVVNAVFLTDGEGSSLNRLYDSSFTGDKPFRFTNGTLVVRDKKTQVTQRTDIFGFDDVSAPYLNVLKQRTGANVIGFRIASRREFRNYLERNRNTRGTLDACLSEFGKEKSFVIKSAGFDEYYFLKSDALDIEEDELEVKSTTTRGYVTAFKKYTKGNIQNKIILNRFIQLIS